MARFTSGWFKMHREATEKDLGKNLHLWSIWTTLLCMATWKESQIIWNGKQRMIPPGSVVLGISELATRWGCSQRTISKWLHYLHDTQRIVLESCARGTLVSICNWNAYQAPDDEACALPAQQVGTDCALTARQVGLNEEVKKVRRKEAAYPTEFLKVWDKHQKGGKAESLTKWRKIPIADREAFETALTNYLAHCTAKGTEPEYIKDLHNFIAKGAGKNKVEPWREFIDRPSSSVAPNQGTAVQASLLAYKREMDEREEVVL
jgi:hypothetical protein